MLVRDVLPIAASASILVVAPLAAPTSSAAVRAPMIQFYGGGPRLLELEKPVTGRVPVARLVAAATGAGVQDVFTKADMAILDAVDRAVVEDDLDYTGLFDYDDN